MLPNSSVTTTTTATTTTISVHSLHGHQQIFEANTVYHSREIYLIPICVLAVLENVAVCAMIYHYRSLRNTTNIFIFGLCITNCLFAGVLLPMHCFQQANEAYLYLTIIIILIYICNLTAVTVERYIAIIRPLHYVNIITKRRAVRVVVGCYLLPTAYCLIPMAWDGRRRTMTHKVYISITLVLFLILPLVFILCVYARVYRETHKFYKKHRALFQGQSRRNGRKSTTSLPYGNGKHEKQSSLLQEATFICCLFTKKINISSSIRYRNQDTAGDSISPFGSDSESVSDIINSTSLVRRKQQQQQQQLSLYRKMVRIATTIEEDDSTESSTTRKTDSVVENTKRGEEETEKEHERKYSLTHNHKHIDFNEKGEGTESSLLKRASTDLSLQLSRADQQQQRGGGGTQSTTPARSLAGSFRLKKLSTASTASSSFDILKVHYAKKCRKAKARLTELKASLAFAMVSLSYMFTWLPVVYMTFLEVIDQMDKIPLWLSTTSIYTIGFSTMIDPLLYGLMLRDFRRAIKNTLKKRRRRSMESF